MQIANIWIARPQKKKKENNNLLFDIRAYTYACLGKSRLIEIVNHNR